MPKLNLTILAPPAVVVLPQPSVESDDAASIASVSPRSDVASTTRGMMSRMARARALKLLRDPDDLVGRKDSALEPPATAPAISSQDMWTSDQIAMRASLASPLASPTESHSANLKAAANARAMKEEMEKEIPHLHSKVGEEADACRAYTAQYNSKKRQHRQVLEEVEMGRAADKLRHQAALDAAQLEEGESTHKRDLEILNERIVELEQQIVVERKIEAELEDRLTVLEGEKATLSASQLAAADAHLREQIDMKTRLAQLEGERVVWGELEAQVKQLDLDLQKTNEELAVEKFRSRGLRQELSDFKKKSAKSEEVGREKEARLALNVGALVALILYYYSDATNLVRELEQHHAVAEKGWMEREELLRNKQDLDILNERIVELEQEIMKERKVEAELENDKRKLQKQVAEVIEGREAADKLLEARAAELASKSAVEMQEAAKAQGALEEAAAAKKVAQQKLRETQQALEKCSKDLLCAHARFESSEREFQHLQGTLQQLRTEIQTNQEALDKTKATLCQQHAEAQRKLQEAAGVKESLDGKISHLEEQLARTELELSEAKKELDTRSRELTDSQSEVEQLTELKAQLRCSTRQSAVLDGNLATTEQELRKIKDDLATRSRELAAAVDSHLREQIDMSTRLEKKEHVAGGLEAQVKQLDLDLHTLPLPEPRRREEIVNEVKESSLTETQEYATRVGMLWVRPEKTNHRVQRRFVLFNQVLFYCPDDIVPLVDFVNEEKHGISPPVRRTDEKKFDVQCAIENLESQKREAAKSENYAEAERLKTEISQLRDTLAACDLDIARKTVNQSASLLSWSFFAKLRRCGHLHLGRCFSVGSAQQVLTDDNANKLFGFVILCGKERHAFWATSVDERDGWVNDIQNVIGERMDTIPSKSISGISMEYMHTLSELSNEEIKSFVHGEMVLAANREMHLQGVLANMCQVFTALQTENQQLKLTLKTWQHDSEERLKVLSKHLEEEQTGFANLRAFHLHERIMLEERIEEALHKMMPSRDSYEGKSLHGKVDELLTAIQELVIAVDTVELAGTHAGALSFSLVRKVQLIGAMYIRLEDQRSSSSTVCKEMLHKILHIQLVLAELLGTDQEQSPVDMSKKVAILFRDKEEVIESIDRLVSDALSMSSSERQSRTVVNKVCELVAMYERRAERPLHAVATQKGGESWVDGFVRTSALFLTSGSPIVANQVDSFDSTRLIPDISTAIEVHPGHAPKKCASSTAQKVYSDQQLANEQEELLSRSKDSSAHVGEVNVKMVRVHQVPPLRLHALTTATKETAGGNRKREEPSSEILHIKHVKTHDATLTNAAEFPSSTTASRNESEKGTIEDLNGSWGGRVESLEPAQGKEATKGFGWSETLHGGDTAGSLLVASRECSILSPKDPCPDVYLENIKPATEAARPEIAAIRCSDGGLVGAREYCRVDGSLSVHESSSGKFEGDLFALGSSSGDSSGTSSVIIGRELPTSSGVANLMHKAYQHLKNKTGLYLPSHDKHSLKEPLDEESHFERSSSVRWLDADLRKCASKDEDLLEVPCTPCTGVLFHNVQDGDVEV